MGNSVFGGHLHTYDSGSTVTKFFTSRAWIDSRAEHPFMQVAEPSGVDRAAAYPGQFGPVGRAISTDRIFPRLIFSGPAFQEGGQS